MTAFVLNRQWNVCWQLTLSGPEAAQLDSATAALAEAAEALTTVREVRQRLRSDRKGKGKGKGPQARAQASGPSASTPLLPGQLRSGFQPAVEPRKGHGKGQFSGQFTFRSIADRNATSSCRACGRRGHWVGDSVCPMARSANIATPISHEVLEMHPIMSRGFDYERDMFRTLTEDERLAWLRIAEPDPPTSLEADEWSPIGSEDSSDKSGWEILMTHLRSSEMSLGPSEMRHPDSQHAIVDTASSLSLAGDAWWEDYQQCLRVCHLDDHIKTEPCRELFKFGSGGLRESRLHVTAPAVVANTPVLLRFHVIEGSDLGLLLGRDSTDGTCNVNLAEHLLVYGQRTCPLKVSQAGHPCTDSLPYAYSALHDLFQASVTKILPSRLRPRQSLAADQHGHGYFCRSCTVLKATQPCAMCRAPTCFQCLDHEQCPRCRYGLYVPTADDGCQAVQQSQWRPIKGGQRMQLASGLAQAQLLHAHGVSPVGVRSVLEASMARDICHTLTAGIHKFHCQPGCVQSCLANGSPLFDPEDGVDEPVEEEEWFCTVEVSRKATEFRLKAQTEAPCAMVGTVDTVLWKVFHAFVEPRAVGSEVWWLCWSDNLKHRGVIIIIVFHRNFTAINCVSLWASDFSSPMERLVQSLISSTKFCHVSEFPSQVGMYFRSPESGISDCAVSYRAARLTASKVWSTGRSDIIDVPYTYTVRTRFAEAGCPLLFDQRHHPRYIKQVQSGIPGSFHGVSDFWGGGTEEDEKMPLVGALGMQLCLLEMPDPFRYSQQLRISAPLPKEWDAIHPTLEADPGYGEDCEDLLG
ncbi:unnamed protein product [Polarella glacialis]|uniref:Uncharacterized protein n=1 Tax=Polarella glacialis TaxID=89957 RepID=A0A813HFR9_POLGL|nr:unnamed protein product [Polarella glacialis]